MRSTRFEIKRNLYELASTENGKRAKEILELLDIYYIYEGESDYVLDTLNVLVPLTHGATNRLAAEYALHYFLASPLDQSTPRSQRKTCEL